MTCACNDSSHLGMTGKVALITGAGRGIGRGCALEMARQGADVVVNDWYHFEGSTNVAADIRRLGRRALAIRADVSKRAHVRRLVKETIHEYGRLDIVIANAALPVRKPFLDLTQGDVAKAWGVGLWGVFHTCQLSAREMVRRGIKGSIVVITSIHAEMPVRGSLPYTTAKAAVKHMVRIMANELAPSRIRVNSVEPGWTDTPGERELVSDDELELQARALPWGRMATIQDIADGVAFLASDKADYITGANLRIDGGFVLPRFELAHPF